MTNQELIDDLKAKNAALKQASADREARDVAEEAATDARIAAQAQTILDLQAIIDAGSNLTEQQKTDLQGVIDDMQAMKTSLEAEDPTPPVV
jgi:uncharacterized coiled-coil protein SlyX